MQLSNININSDIRKKHSMPDFREIVLNFLVPILLLGVSAGLFFMYLLPTSKKIPELETTLSQKGNEVVALEAKVVQLTVLEQNKSVLMEDLIKLSWALEERDKVPELSQQVMQMSIDAGVSFVSLDYTNTNKNMMFQPVTTTPDALVADPNLYREEKVNVALTSTDYPSLVKMFQTSENSIRLFKVETFRISAQTTGTGTLNTNLIMASPYLNPAFSSYSETSAPIDLQNASYREFMQKIDTFKNYAEAIDATLPKI